MLKFNQKYTHLIESQDLNNITNKTFWVNLSLYNKLSEEFMERHANQIDWYFVSMWQNLSKDFIIKFKNRINFECLEFNKSIDLNLLNKF